MCKILKYKKTTFSVSGHSIAKIQNGIEIIKENNHKMSYKKNMIL